MQRFKFHQNEFGLLSDWSFIQNMTLYNKPIINFESFQVSSQTFQFAIVFIYHLRSLLFTKYLLKWFYFHIIHQLVKVHHCKEIKYWIFTCFLVLLNRIKCYKSSRHPLMPFQILHPKIICYYIFKKLY